MYLKSNRPFIISKAHYTLSTNKEKICTYVENKLIIAKVQKKSYLCKKIKKLCHAN